MEGKNWGKFQKDKCKLEKKINKIYIRWQKTFAKKKLKTNKKIKDIDNKINEIIECREKIQKIKKLKNEKQIFKQIFKSKDDKKK